ncbi:efflux RND transporter periplasmic adaptor subunit [Pseudomonas syringae pv. actinidiae]|nr:efflux RND transporter periplasmic adaptor subunit [Pseudomonas syringae pv. actinidiae]
MSSKIFAKYLMTFTFVIYAAIVSLLSGCSADAPPAAAEKPNVSVQTVQPQTQALTTELAGRTQAFMVAEIRPQVSGIVQQRLFVEGAEVKVAEADVQTARINLGYTRIVSPISGRIETSTVTPGALVVAQQDSALTTVQQLDPIYVDVTQSTTELLRLKRDLASGALQANGTGEANITLKLDDGSLYNQDGRLQFSGVSVNEGTGTVTLRARFANPDRLLLPGMYVKAVIEQARDDKAILIPQKAVSRSASGVTTALLVVNGKIEQRVVNIDRAVGNQWWVTSGLLAGDQVVVEGGQKVRVGAEVAVQVSENADATAASATAPVATRKEG